MRCHRVIGAAMVSPSAANDIRTLARDRGGAPTQMMPDGASAASASSISRSRTKLLRHCASLRVSATTAALWPWTLPGGRWASKRRIAAGSPLESSDWRKARDGNALAISWTPDHIHLRT